MCRHRKQSQFIGPGPLQNCSGVGRKHSAHRPPTLPFYEGRCQGCPPRGDRRRLSHPDFPFKQPREIERCIKGNDLNVAGERNVTGQGAFGQADRLNRGCFCVTLDRSALTEALDLEVGTDGFAAQLLASHPTLFSAVPVFVPATVLAEMMRIVDAVEAAALLEGYRAASLAYAPPIATADFGPIGAFMGYDFHITPAGPQLIEANTNAGGAFLNAALARAQRACCSTEASLVGSQPTATFADDVTQMFTEEWRRQRGAGEPACIAIVDDAPQQQHLYPEFQLAKALLEQHGIEVVIADPGDFTLIGGRLSVGDRPVDLVYNRLVDFALEEPRHAVLRDAYVSGNVVVTPNPHVHALIADKRNLALLSDAGALKRWGLAQPHVTALERGVPKTVIVSVDDAENLWRDRDQLFFKPARGHASKAAYRGDKVTRKVWAQVLQGQYVAQAYAAPSVRDIALEEDHAAFKVDVRLYTYGGALLLAAARLYQGQTTNMRTQGGGFAPVLVTQGT